MIALGRRSSYTPDSTGPPPSLAAKLSPRECEVAILIADGLSNKQIGALLGISHESVRAYVDRIVRKLKIDRSMSIRVVITREVIFAWAETDAA